MKTPVPNPGYARTAVVLQDNGYQCIRQFSAVLPRGLVASEDCFQVWAGRKGTLILQVWKDGHGVSTYADWALGHTFEELKAAL